MYFCSWNNYINAFSPGQITKEREDQSLRCRVRYTRHTERMPYRKDQRGRKAGRWKGAGESWARLLSQESLALAWSMMGVGAALKQTELQNCPPSSLLPPLDARRPVYYSSIPVKLKPVGFLTQRNSVNFLGYTVSISWMRFTWRRRKLMALQLLNTSSWGIQPSNGDVSSAYYSSPLELFISTCSTHLSSLHTYMASPGSGVAILKGTHRIACRMNFSPHCCSCFQDDHW